MNSFDSDDTTDPNPPSFTPLSEFVCRYFYLTRLTETLTQTTDYPYSNAYKPNSLYRLIITPHYVSYERLA